MLSENIPVTMATSSNDSTLSLVDFIEYSIINDLNIVKIYLCLPVTLISSTLRSRLNGWLIQGKLQ
jgi:hypothetical protein